MSKGKTKTRLVSKIGPASGSAGAGMFNVGFAYIKRVAVLEDGSEETTTDVIPITTARLDEVRKRFGKDRAPRPPIRTTFISHESEEGKAFGLTKPSICDVPNYADEKYVSELEEFNERMGWAIAAEAINVPLFFIDGSGKETEAKTTEEKISAMRSAGFNTAQILQIMADVTRIGAFTEEERRSFFAANSASK